MIPRCVLCGRDCTDHEFCRGCARYVCGAHRGPPAGAHEAAAHDAPVRWLEVVVVAVVVAAAVAWGTCGAWAPGGGR